jgi:hypothetical protein
MTAKKKDAEKTQKADTGPLCTVQSCDKPVFLRGLCTVHWARPKAR